MTTYTQLPTPLGDLLATAGPDGITGLYFPEHRRGPTVAEGWMRAEAPFGDLDRQLAAYFDGTLIDFQLPVVLVGTPFQQSVWAAVQAIPHGSTTTYGALATQLGNSRAVRAVAGAVARNPVSIVVPCHRVLGAAGRITGYAGGVERKQRLLALEEAARAGTS